MPQMPPMTEDDAPGQENQAEESGDVTALARSAGDTLAKLAEAINSSDAVTDKDKAKMADILQNYVDLVENGLTAAPGQDAEEPAQQEMPVMSAMGGPKGMPMSHQYK